MDRKLARLLRPDNFKFFVVIFIMTLILAYYNLYIGALAAITLIVLVVISYLGSRKAGVKLEKAFEEFTTDLRMAGRSSIVNAPVPVTLIDSEGIVSWYNNMFAELLVDEDIMGENIEDVIPDVKVSKIAQGEDLGEITLNDKRLKVFYSASESGEQADKKMTLIYWVDVTYEAHIKQIHEEEKPVIALVQVDSLDDVLAELKDDKRPFLNSEIDNKIYTWANRMDGMIKKYSRDKYLIIFENKHLMANEQKRFEILDEVRDINVGNKIPVTLSIGIGTAGKTFNDMEERAFSALELALGRGGDQAVVRKKGNFEFYGGKSKTVEKKNRVKPRIVAHALRPLIDECSNVFIMGHRFPDMDSFGSAMGMLRAVKTRGKKGYIVMSEVNVQIKNVFSKFTDNPEYEFVNEEQIKSLMDKDSLLIIVDTNRPSYTIYPDIIDLFSSKVMLDHHRLSTEPLGNITLRYIEPYASSTSELVTEILPFIGSDLKVEPIEADALLAGIMVDTKSFSYKTGVRTFEAASLLRRYGADSTNVKTLFKDGFDVFIAKANLIRDAKMFGEDMAISVCEEIIPNAQLVAAQAADELLNVQGIDTSFVIGCDERGMVFISGRALGDTNVQVILEKLGGGGHMSVAGAQLMDVEIFKAEKMLKEAIGEYFTDRLANTQINDLQGAKLSSQKRFSENGSKI